MPDSGQEHLADSDDGFLVTTVRFDSAVTRSEFRMICGADQGIGNLDEERFETGSGLRDPSGFDMFGASVVSGAAACPGNEVFGRRENRHVGTDLREDRDSGHGIFIQTWDRADQVQMNGIRFGKALDFLLNSRLMLLKLINMIQALPQLDSLLP